MGALTCIRSDPVEPVDLKSPCRERSTKRTCTFTFTTDTRLGGDIKFFVKCSTQHLMKEWWVVQLNAG